VRLHAQGLVHNIGRVWTVEGQTIVFHTVSVRYLHSLKYHLNVRCMCGHQALWITGFDDVAFTEEMPTCLACLVSP
jgi:hypothetical protein